MSVKELNPEQLDWLRQTYNYEANDSTAIVDKTDIPDEVICEYYAGIEFSTEDFPL